MAAFRVRVIAQVAFEFDDIEGATISDACVAAGIRTRHQLGTITVGRPCGISDIEIHRLGDVGH